MSTSPLVLRSFLGGRLVAIFSHRNTKIPPLAFSGCVKRAARVQCHHVAAGDNTPPSRDDVSMEIKTWSTCLVNLQDASD